MGQDPGDAVVEVQPIDQNGSAPWEPTVQGIKAARSWTLSPEAKVFVGRWKESDPDFPNDPPFEVIWRENHTYSSLALFADEKGKIEERILTHGLWVRAGDKVYLLDLIAGGIEEIPGEEQSVREYDLKQVGNNGCVFEVKEDGVITKIRGLPVKKFTQPEMQPFNTPEALKGDPT